MGRDKATMQLGPGGVPLARHLGSMLANVTAIALEIGPGVSGLAVRDDPREGPLVAIATGAGALAETGWRGDVLVLATDLPLLSQRLLAALATWPAPSGQSVAPVAGGRSQPLCARWSQADLEVAAELVEQGERRVQAAFGAGAGLLVLGGRDLAFDLESELADADDEAALRRLGLEPDA